MQNKSNDDTVIAIVAFCLLAGMLFVGRSYLIKRRNRGKEVAVEATTAEPAKSVAAAPKKVEVTDGCTDRKPLDFFFLDARDIALVQSGKVHEILAGPIFCIKLGPLPFKFRANYSETERGFLRLRGQAVIDEIKTYEPDTIPETILKQEQRDLTVVQARKYLKDVNAKTHAPTSRWAIVSFHLAKPIELPKNYQQLEDFSVAKGIGARKLERMLKDGAKLIDVRSAASFAKSHDSLAVNLPYLIADQDPLSTIVKFQTVDKFDIDKIPAPKNQSVIFLGENNDDVAPIRAGFLAARAGFTKIFWMRDGEAERLARLQQKTIKN